MYSAVPYKITTNNNKKGTIMENNIYKKNKERGIPPQLVNMLIAGIILLLLFLARESLTAFILSVITIGKKYSSYFITGLLITLGLSAIAVIIGTIIGSLIYFLRSSKSKFISFLAVSFVEMIRGTPLITQLFIVFFGAALVFDYKALGISISNAAFLAGVIAVSINSGAYISEIIRSGIQSIDKGQIEAGRSVGMSTAMTMKEIVIPQAIKNILPALGNEFIAVIKETSIASSIGVTDIMYNVNLVRGNSFKSMEPLIIAAVLYFVLTFTLSRLVRILERKLKESD